MRSRRGADGWDKTVLRTFYPNPQHLSLSLSLSLLNLHSLHRSTVACVLYPEYEGDSISGMTYELDVSSFPSGFFDDVEYSKTVLTISEASILRARGGGNSANPAIGHGGGIISMKNGTKAKKERLDNGNGNGNGGGLRGRDGVKNGMPFERSRGRRLAQTMGNR